MFLRTQHRLQQLVPDDQFTITISILFIPVATDRKQSWRKNSAYRSQREHDCQRLEHWTLNEKPENILKQNTAAVPESGGDNGNSSIEK